MRVVTLIKKLSCFGVFHQGREVLHLFLIHIPSLLLHLYIHNYLPLNLYCDNLFLLLYLLIIYLRFHHLLHFHIVRNHHFYHHILFHHLNLRFVISYLHNLVLQHLIIIVF